ncbi:MAG: nitroreductase family protein [Syntrophaceticus sp.]|jgi:nitroreductase|nr:nitroreductase family protein [Syntrophaceticus sp.]MDD3314565.1 nitroreductase family protein [Syntrophaceticus sp.]MDD4359554.1 nitroreductase family protein [Syntrophaceticus sp.]MDD4782378.1 nitroreductase family protein [Syntrophaceticus sp.]HBG21897.1 nitroreductase [Peptococcaceae bacterium]
MNVSEAIMERKSIRAYLDKPIPADVLEKIITAGRWAPNAGDFQISVILNNEVRQKINDETKKFMLASEGFAKERASLPGYEPLYGAPVLILFSGSEELPFNAANTALAVENMLLEATGLGLGSCFLASPCWVLNGSDYADLAKEAGIPEGHAVQCAIILGYPAAENKFSGERAAKGTVNYIK